MKCVFCFFFTYQLCYPVIIYKINGGVAGRPSGERDPMLCVLSNEAWLGHTCKCSELWCFWLLV